MPRIRDDLRSLVPYDPDMRDVEVMLSANENSYGVPPEVRSEIDRRLAEVALNRYPQATAPALREALGRMWGVEAANVVVSNGGDELLFNLELAYGGPGRVLVNCPPTFSAYALYAELTGTGLLSVARRPDFSVDEGALLEAVRDPAVSLVVVTSPNNPTGNLVDPAFVERLASSTDALVLVDEAYAEFAPAEASCVEAVGRHDNVCVLRTLSKAYALAGCRVGYLIAPKGVAQALLSVRLPYSVSSLDQAAALTAVERREAFEPVTRALVANRAALAEGLGRLAADVCEKRGDGSCAVFPSAANFLLMRVPDAADIHELLAERHSILVRDFSATPGLSGCLRVTVGTPEENDRLIAALRELLGV